MTIRTHTKDERKPEKAYPTTHKGGPQKKETKTNNTHTRQNERVGYMARERRDNDKKERKKHNITQTH